MQITFYHWGHQCPCNSAAFRLLKQYESRLEITRIDITGKPDVAWEQQIYFPTLTVVDGTYRYFAPLGPEFLESLCRGILPQEKPYRPKPGTKVTVGTLEPLTRENLSLAAAMCTGGGCSPEEKSAWLEAQGQRVFGILNRAGDRILGGAEFLPSSLVPYDIPKRREAAFLTCLYGSHPEADYKSGPLQALEEMLRGRYRVMLAISDEIGVFPNGDLALFLRNGYQDLGVIWQESSYCRLHLMEKEL